MGDAMKELLRPYGLYAGVTERSDIEEQFVQLLFREIERLDPGFEGPLERTAVSPVTGGSLERALRTQTIEALVQSLVRQAE